MIVGLLTCRGFLYNAHSLKDKRSVIKSLLAKAKQRTNVSAAEVEDQELWQRTTLAFVSVSNSKVIVEKELQHVLQIIDRAPDIEITETIYDWL